MKQVAFARAEATPAFIRRDVATDRQRRRRLDAGLSGSYSYNFDGLPTTAPNARSGQVSK